VTEWGDSIVGGERRKINHTHEESLSENIQKQKRERDTNTPHIHTHRYTHTEQ
jgi:hypothetical protein